MALIGVISKFLETLTFKSGKEKVIKYYKEVLSIIFLLSVLSLDTKNIVSQVLVAFAILLWIIWMVYLANVVTLYLVDLKLNRRNLLEMLSKISEKVAWYLILLFIIIFPYVFSSIFLVVPLVVDKYISTITLNIPFFGQIYNTHTIKILAIFYVYLKLFYFPEYIEVIQKYFENFKGILERGEVSKIVTFILLVSVIYLEYLVLGILPWSLIKPLFSLVTAAF